MKWILGLIVFVTQTHAAIAQEWIWVEDNRLINPSGIECTGIVRPDLGDIDGDGYLDVVLLDKDGLQIYRNLGINEIVQFERRQDWEMGIDVGNLDYRKVPTLADLDGDGLPEVIIQTNDWQVWKNVRTAGEVSWVNADSLLSGVLGDHYLATVDLDADEDLDIVTFLSYNEFLVYWNTGSKTEPVWEPDPEALDFDEITQELNNISFLWNIRFADVDSDGDADFFATWEIPISYGSMVILENVSIDSSLQFKRFEPAKQFGRTFAFFFATGDVNNNNLTDFILGESPLSFWKNSGSPENLEVDTVIKWGAPLTVHQASISFGDVDGDSDLDLILGSLEPYSDIEPMHSLINLVENIGDANQLQLRDDITAEHIGFFFDATVQLNDFDRNGDLDIAIGARHHDSDSLTTVSFFRRQQGASGLYWDEDLFVFSQFADDSIYYDPHLYDFNGNTSLDLLIQVTGGYQFFENTGTIETPVWEERADWLQGLDELSHFRAAIGDLNFDDLPDLVFGEADGRLSFYENIGAIDRPKWLADTTAFSGISVDSNASPALADLDGDSDLDLIIGDENGKIVSYRNDIVVHVESNEEQVVESFLLKQNYPNPFNPETTIEYEIDKPGPVQLSIYNLLGQKIRTLVNERQSAGFYRMKWDGKEGSKSLVSSGVYIYELKQGSLITRRKMLFIR